MPGLSELAWILVGGLLLAALAMIGSVTLLLPPAVLERLLLPLVSLAAGTLLGGAFFHLPPRGYRHLEPLAAATWPLAGFVTFLALEQFLHWHHAHWACTTHPKPVTYPVLAGDGVHTFPGGLGSAGTLLISRRAGVMAWLGAVAHEVPQELDDSTIPVQGGWSRRRALLWNLLSALTFPLGAVLACAASRRFAVAGLVLFAAGNFLHIAASDLIPEIKGQTGMVPALLHLGIFVAGLPVMFILAGGGSNWK